MLFNIRHTHRADRSTLKEKQRVQKKFDTPISEVGRYQAFKIGVKLGELVGRDKKFCFIVSPQLRCMETAEHILHGLDLSYYKIHNKKLHVEDAIREVQSEECVQNFENFDKLHINENDKIIDYPYEMNTLEFLNEYHGKEKFQWPEHKHIWQKRASYAEQQILDFAKQNQNLVVVYVSHGYFTEFFRERKEIPQGFYHYGAVNQYELDKESNTWKLMEINAQYYQIIFIEKLINQLIKFFIQQIQIVIIFCR